MHIQHSCVQVPASRPVEACACAEDTRTGAAGIFDSAVQTIGRAAFFPQFALFPVRYLDSDMAVFTFPPLRDSLIAVRKVS